MDLKKLSRDKWLAYALLAVVWLAACLISLTVLPLTKDEGVMALVVVSALAICLFNTASILAMVRHYAQDLEPIFGLDVQRPSSDPALSE